jgi:flagellar hook-associated protein 3 FlgL
MSGITSVALPSDYGMMNSLVTNAATVKQRLDQLISQASTGLISNTYAGLGAGASISLNMQPQIANMQTLQNNVDVATGRMSVTQTALTSLQSIASSFYAQLNNVDGIDSSAVDTIAASARDALRQVAGLLDTQDAGVYVFSGQDTGNPPVPNPDNIADGTAGTFFATIQTAVGQLGVTQTAAQVAQTTQGVAGFGGVPSPFSVYLSTNDPPTLPTIQVGQNQSETIGLSASHNGLIPQPPADVVNFTTTGSYMRDTLRALATIGSLSSAQVNTPGFQDLVQNTRTSLIGVVSAMGQDAGVLGNVQSSIKATQTQLADTQTALNMQVSSAQNVDMASTLSQLSQVQTQMQASYQLISGLSGLSLVKYLPV